MATRTPPWDPWRGSYATEGPTVVDSELISAESQETEAAPRRSRWARRLLLAVGLLLPLIGAAVWMIESFQPFANAAGGCGGG